MAIEGETRLILHQETATANFVVDAPAVAVIVPDGSPVSPPLDVSVDPAGGTPSLSHTFAALVEHWIHGVYYVRWQFGQDTQIRIRPEYYFCASLDIWDMTRELLRRKASFISDAELDKLYVFLVQKLQVDYAVSCSLVYSQLTDGDLEHFDIALAYLAATRYAFFHPELFNAGAVRRQVQGPVSWEYATRPNTALSPQDTWLSEAFDHLNMIKCLSDALAVFNTKVELNSTAGPRRGVYETGPRLGINDLYIMATSEQQLVYPMGNRYVVW